MPKDELRLLIKDLKEEMKKSSQSTGFRRGSQHQGQNTDFGRSFQIIRFLNGILNVLI